MESEGDFTPRPDGGVLRCWLTTIDVRESGKGQDGNLRPSRGVETRNHIKRIPYL